MCKLYIFCFNIYMHVYAGGMITIAYTAEHHLFVD